MVNWANGICGTNAGSTSSISSLQSRKNGGNDRYFKICERIYFELDMRLKNSKYLAYQEYTIADIATFPWIASMNNDIGLKNLRIYQDGILKFLLVKK